MERTLKRAKATSLPVCPIGPYFRRTCMVVNRERQIIFHPVWIVSWITHAIFVNSKDNLRKSQFGIQLVKCKTVKICNNWEDTASSLSHGVILLNGCQNPSLKHCKAAVYYLAHRTDKLPFHITPAVNTASSTVIFTLVLSYSVPSRRPCWCWWRVLSEMSGLTQNQMV